MPKLEQFLAYVVAGDSPDDEGIPCVSTSKGREIPLIGADAERMRCLYNAAVTVARTTGKPVKLVRSTGVEVVEVIQPDAQDRPSCHPEKHP